jgi:processing peptidase subunit alpha
MLRRGGNNRPVSAAAALCAAQRFSSVAEYHFGQPALSQPVPAPLPARSLPAPAAAPKITKFPNGLRCISVEQEGCQASVGLYALAGARHDPRNGTGLSHMLRIGLTQSNMDNALFQVDRNLRANGVSQETVDIRKKFIGVRLTARADKWEASATDVFSGFAVPRFAESDLERYRDTLDNQYEELRWQRPRDFVKERVESVAFFREPLGSSRSVLPTNNDALSTEKLLDQYSKYVVPSRMVLAGVNIPHNDLLAAYENAPFPHSESSPHHVRTAGDRKEYNELTEELQYTGGEEYFQEARSKEMGTKPNMEEETAIAIAFRSFGRDMALSEFAAGLVAKQLIDMAIDDNLRVNREGNTQGVRSFYTPFSSTGLLGFTILSSPESAVKLTTDAATVFRTLKPSETEIAFAKARAAVAFHFDELETTGDLCDFLVNASNSNGVTTPATFFDAIANVKAVDVTKVLEKGRTALPSLYVTGETLAFPTLRQLGYN